MTERTHVRRGGASERLREIGCDLATTINRLIQTALIHGATEIEIQTGTAVAIVADNGKGVPGPSTLIDTIHGLTSPGPVRLPVLLGRRPVIESQQADGVRWTAQPTDEEMTGGGLPMTRPDHGSRRMGNGTTVLIDLLHDDGADIEQVARMAARGWPAQITVDGTPVGPLTEARA